MNYRLLGKTGLEASILGFGCAQLARVDVAYGVRLVRRALDLGINYFDCARGYFDAEITLGLALQDRRERAIIATKTGVKTREDAWRQINESLDRMQIDHIDVLHLHGIGSNEDADERLGSGGAIEALERARAEGLISYIGCTGHTSIPALTYAIQQYDFDVVLCPLNIIERQSADELLPLCEKKDVGITIMKPLATGLLPAPLAIRWLLSQPVDCVAVGISSLEQLEENVSAAVNTKELDAEEQEEVARLRTKWAHQRCRICRQCMPCPQEIGISYLLGTDVMYDMWRTFGSEAFAAFPWKMDEVPSWIERREKHLAAVRSCTRCGLCEERCPHGLPIIEMLEKMIPEMEEMIDIYRGILAAN